MLTGCCTGIFTNEAILGSRLSPSSFGLVFLKLLREPADRLTHGYDDDNSKHDGECVSSSLHRSQRD